MLRSLLGHVALSLASLALFLGSSEGLARIAGYEPEPARAPMFSWRDSGELWLMKPNSVTRTLQGDYPVRINNFGVRGPSVRPKDSDVCRILFLGDSVTFGFGVREEDTFASKLRERRVSTGKRLDVVAAALGGWSARQQRLFLEEHGARIVPDLIVVNVVLNDITDLRKGLREIGAAPGLAAVNVLTGLARRSAAVAALKQLYVSAVQPLAREVESVTELVNAPDSPAVRDAIALHLAELDAILTRSEQLAVPLGLVIIPFQFQMRSQRAPAPQVAMKEFARAHDVPVLDLLEPMKHSPRKPLFLDHNHLTPNGHAVVGDAIYEWLEASGLVREACG